MYRRRGNRGQDQAGRSLTGADLTGAKLIAAKWPENAPVASSLLPLTRVLQLQADCAWSLSEVMTPYP